MEDLEIKQEIERTIIAFFTEMNGWEIVCKSNHWLIDSKKRKWDDDTKWSNIYL